MTQKTLLTIAVVAAVLIVCVGVIAGYNAGSQSVPPVTQQYDTVVPQDSINEDIEERLTESAYTVAVSDYLDTPRLIDTVPVAELSAEEEHGLLVMREEEKLARDVYTTLGDKWGQRVFTNIAASEQTHTDAVRELLDRYGIDDPVTNDTTGVFTNPDVQKLYNDLVAQGNISLTAALGVGATIEDLDINDLQEYIAQTDNDDITIVYENLMRGSRNHLRAFNRQLENNGIAYRAQYLSQEEVDAILAGDQEMGNGAGGGQALHNGRGHNGQ